MERLAGSLGLAAKSGRRKLTTKDTKEHKG
jgi:hypothetical protein